MTGPRSELDRIGARLGVLEEALAAPLAGSSAEDAARRVWRIARLERTVGEEALILEDSEPLFFRVLELHRRMEGIAGQVEFVLQELVAQASALRLLGLVPCFDCSTWFKTDDPAARAGDGDLWFCGDHAALIETAAG
jgi:hypothetical protein